MSKQHRKRTIRSLLAITLLSLVHASLRAQAVPARFNPAVDLAVTYSATHAIHTTGDSFWLQGGGIDLNTRFYKGLGLTASVTGLHNNSATSTIAPLDIVTVAFGPSYTYHAGGRISLQGRGLVGEADGFHSLFAYGSGPTPSLSAGTTDSANSLAIQAGGSVDFALSKSLAIRAVEVDYLRTQLPNGGTNVQNNLRLAAGLVVRFGR